MTKRNNKEFSMKDTFEQLLSSAEKIIDKVEKPKSENLKKNLAKMRKLGRKGKLEDAALIARAICRQIGSEKQKGMKEYWQDELASILVGFMKFTDFSSY
jgi:hypothetical protein